MIILTKAIYYIPFPEGEHPDGFITTLIIRICHLECKNSKLHCVAKEQRTLSFTSHIYGHLYTVLICCMRSSCSSILNDSNFGIENCG